MVQLVWTKLTDLTAFVRVVSLVNYVTLNSSSVAQIRVKIRAPVWMKLTVLPVCVLRDLMEHCANWILTNAHRIRVKMELHVWMKLISFSVCASQDLQVFFVSKTLMSATHNLVRMTRPVSTVLTGLRVFVRLVTLERFAKLKLTSAYQTLA